MHKAALVRQAHGDDGSGGNAMVSLMPTPAVAPTRTLMGSRRSRRSLSVGAHALMMVMMTMIMFERSTHDDGDEHGQFHHEHEHEHEH